MADTILRPETINNLSDAVIPSFALLAGMQLDLFTPLSEGPLDAEKLASLVGVQSNKLRPLLYVLVISGLLTVEEDRFSNTQEANQYLVRGKSKFMGDRAGLNASNWQRMLKTADILRAGKPQVDYDDPSNPDEHKSLFRGLYPGAVADAKRLMGLDDFSAYRKMLDIGGGAGGLAITVAKANPKLEATVLDLPSVIPITHDFVQKAGAGGQVKVVAADAVNEEIPGEFDVIVARHLIQVLSEDKAIKLLKNVVRALKPGRVFHLIGWILDDSRLSPENIVHYNLILLTSNEYGQAYTEQLYRDWFNKAGFEDFQRVVMPDGVSFVRAQKPH